LWPTFGVCSRSCDLDVRSSLAVMHRVRSGAANPGSRALGGEVIDSLWFGEEVFRLRFG